MKALTVALIVVGTLVGSALLKAVVPPAVSADSGLYNTQLLRQMASDIHCIRIRASGGAC